MFTHEDVKLYTRSTVKNDKVALVVEPKLFLPVFFFSGRKYETKFTETR